MKNLLKNVKKDTVIKNVWMAILSLIVSFLCAPQIQIFIAKLSNLYYQNNNTESIIIFYNFLILISLPLIFISSIPFVWVTLDYIISVVKKDKKNSLKDLFQKYLLLTLTTLYTSILILWIVVWWTGIEDILF